MPSWKFLVVRHFGGSQQRRFTCARIKTNVENLGLSSILPLAKYEMSRGMEYYFGIVFDESAPYALESACQVLTSSGIAVGSNPIIIDAEQVRTLLRGSLEFESFTIPILYEKESEPENISSNQLLSLADVEGSKLIGGHLNDDDVFDKLLYWCSSTGSGDLARLKKTCQLLGINTEWGGVWSIIRRFALLGHLEFDLQNSVRWGVVPPVIIKTSASNYYYLSGQRIPSLINDLRKKFNVIENEQNSGPKQIFVESINGELTELDSKYKIEQLGCVSQELSMRLPNYDQWSKKLSPWNEKDFGRYTIQKFLLETEEFVEANQPVRFKNGLYKFIFKDDNHKTETIAYYDDIKDNWVCGDFYSLRFLTRHNLDICRAFFIENQNELRVPFYDRWPMPFERALVLASGMLPSTMETESGTRILRYCDISSDLALRLCGLLSIKMEGK